VVLASLWWVAPSNAQLDPFEFEVYGYRTLPRGMMELELLNSVVAKGHTSEDAGTSAGEFPSSGMWRNAYEVTYGITDRIEAAAYLNLAVPSTKGLWYAGSKYRMRGSLFDPGTLPVDLGWYIELEWWNTPQFDGQQLELELRPIIEKDIGRFMFIANPKFERGVFVGEDKHGPWEFGYNCGAYYRWMRYLSPGVEFYGALGSMTDTDPISAQQHYIFPVIWGEAPWAGVEYNVGPGIGLTTGSDRVLVKFNFELERFIGSLFGPSPEGSWFY